MENTIGKDGIILRDNKTKAQLFNFCLASIFSNDRMIFKEESVKFIAKVKMMLQ